MSAWHRFRDVYTALGFAPENIGRIDLWNLRGPAYRWISSLPTDPPRPAKNYMAIVH